VKALLRRRRLLINGALALLLVVGIGVAYLSLHDDAGASSPGRIVRVSRGNIVSSVSASGSVASANSRDLAFGASGTVDTIKVQVGDKVKKGRLLATLDDASARDALQSAQAALSAAEAGDTSTPSGYSSYVQAKAARDSAQRSLDGTELKAPFSGTIVAVNGSVGGSSSGSGGSSTSSGSTGSSGAGGGGGGSSSAASSSASSGSTGSGFITIADTTKLDIKGEFTESDVAKVKKGQQASVTFDAMQGTRASGKVTAIDQTSTTTNNVVQYGVTVTLTDPPEGLRIGATATVQVTTASAENVLYVPTAAVRTAGGQSTVTVLSGGKQVPKVVQTGTQGDQGTEIKSGLNEGDQVLIADTGGGTGGTGFPAGRFPGGGGGGLGGGLGGGAGRGGGRG
jgi:macrolide-specific efflux system membrane fusion protein